MAGLSTNPFIDHRALSEWTRGSPLQEADCGGDSAPRCPRPRRRGRNAPRSADILVCGFRGLSSAQYVPAEKVTELESSVNPPTGKPALLAADTLTGRASAVSARRI